MDEPQLEVSGLFLRSLVERHGDSFETDQAESDRLTRAVELASIRRAMLVPVASVSRRALLSLATSPKAELLADDLLVEAWTTEVMRACQSFAIDPKAWIDPDSIEFKERCGVAFGVSDESVDRLTALFHLKPATSRLGVLVRLIRSPSFSYVLRAIRSMDEADDIDVDDPGESLRLLLREVAGTE